MEASVVASRAAGRAPGSPLEPLDASGDPHASGQAAEVLAAEYGLLAGALSAVWSASLVRASLFLGVISALGVALGLAAQAGGGFGSTFRVFALVSLPLALFLGLATFARTVEIQREAIVYVTGMNRIRHFMQELAPASRPYFVLSSYDDEAGIYRSQGTGIRLHPPRHRLVFALVQTQGIVAVMSAVLAAAIVGVALAPFDTLVAWLFAIVAFGLLLVGLFRYWERQIQAIRTAIRPRFPTPPEQQDALI
jgi:hypothetical protein